MTELTEKHHDWVRGLRLRYFTTKEVFYLGDSHQSNGLNSLPPQKLWDNIVETLWLADMARHQLGVPIRISSGYRNLVYNRAIGSGDGSQHPKFTALDLQTTRYQRLYNILLKARGAGLFKGGLGIYHGSKFVHLDTRGSNASWQG